MNDVRIPKQHRSIQTKKRIMKAAFNLYAKKGIHGTNSREIAEKAGVSIGSFYAYFKNKKTLLLEMVEDYLDRHFATIWKHLDSYPLDSLRWEDIHSILKNVFLAYEISPAFHKQTHALRYSDPDINRIYEREVEREVRQVKSLLDRNRNHSRLKDSTAAAIVIHNAVENVAHTAKFIGSPIEEERLIIELTNMIYSYFQPVG